MSAPTAVVSPLAAELAGALAATTARRVVRLHRPGHRRSERLRWPRWTLTLGRLAGEEVALLATGDGPAAAAAGLEALIAAVRPSRLLVLGVAGGLTPGLAEGTLVAARRVVAGSGRSAPRAPDAAWLAAALAGGAVAGTAVAADRILLDAAARQAVLRQALPPGGAVAAPARARPAAAITAPAAGSASTAAAHRGAPPLVATVDLESAAYARVAAAWSLPYLVIRAVLDPADETLPLDFEACRGGNGRVSNARVVLRALRHPRSFAALWRLRARVRDAAARLGALAAHLVGVPAGPAGPADSARAAVGEVPDECAATGGLEPRREQPAAVAGRRGA